MAEDIWEHIGGDGDAPVGPCVESDPPPSFTTTTNSCKYRQWKARRPTLAGNDSTGAEPTRRMAGERLERRKPDSGRSRDGRCADDQ